MSKTSKRIVFSIILLFSVFLMPWYVIVGIAVAGMFLFERYIEGLVALICIDVLYGVPLFGISLSLYASLGGVIAFFVIERIKKRLRFYAI